MKGRTASAWLDALASRRRKRIPTALKKIGTNALPYAVRNLVRNDSRWRGGYKNLWSSFLNACTDHARSLSRTSRSLTARMCFFPSDPTPSVCDRPVETRELHVRQSASLGVCALRRKTPAADQAIRRLRRHWLIRMKWFRVLRPVGV